MRSHLGCTGSVSLGPLGEGTRKRLENIPASWLEYSPESASLVVRHVQPDDVPPLREITGELMDFLHALSNYEREQIPGGDLFYLDEISGQYVRLKISQGGTLAATWARVDYRQARWEVFRNQPMKVVLEPFERLNGAVSFECHPNAANNIRRILDGISGHYSQGEYAISSTVGSISLTLRDVNADGLTIVNAIRYMAKPGTLTGEIDISSFRTGDLEDYCRFSFRMGETWMARPVLWPDDLNTPPPQEREMSRAA